MAKVERRELIFFCYVFRYYTTPSTTPVPANVYNYTGQGFVLYFIPCLPLAAPVLFCFCLFFFLHSFLLLYGSSRWICIEQNIHLCRHRRSFIIIFHFRFSIQYIQYRYVYIVRGQDCLTNIQYTQMIQENDGKFQWNGIRTTKRHYIYENTGSNKRTRANRKFSMNRFVHGSQGEICAFCAFRKASFPIQIQVYVFIYIFTERKRDGVKNV